MVLRSEGVIELRKILDIRFIRAGLSTWMRTAHPKEPFPLYRPSTRYCMFRHGYHINRWRLLRHFRHGSPLDGYTVYNWRGQARVGKGDPDG